MVLGKSPGFHGPPVSFMAWESAHLSSGLDQRIRNGVHRVCVAQIPQEMLSMICALQIISFSFNHLVQMVKACNSLWFLAGQWRGPESSQPLGWFCTGFHIAPFRAQKRMREVSTSPSEEERHVPGFTWDSPGLSCCPGVYPLLLSKVHLLDNNFNAHPTYRAEAHIQLMWNDTEKAATLWRVCLYSEQNLHFFQNTKFTPLHWAQEPPKPVNCLGHSFLTRISSCLNYASVLPAFFDLL